MTVSQCREDDGDAGPGDDGTWSLWVSFVIRLPALYRLPSNKGKSESLSGPATAHPALSATR